MKKLTKISLVIGITLVVGLVLMVVGNKIKGDILREYQEEQLYQEWLVENCKCLARERISCPSGFQMINQTCKDESASTVTSKLISCSEYDCSGEIKSWNNETEKWEDKING